MAVKEYYQQQKDVGAMASVSEIDYMYDAISRYYGTLEKLGYMSYSNVKKLLVYIFYIDYVLNDYRGTLSRADYLLIDKALYCLFGTTCLMPYPDYLKMGKFNLGSVTEIAKRVEALENKDVLKLIHDPESVINDIDSDIMVVADED